MKKIFYVALCALSISVISSCTEKKSTWTEAEKETWSKECNQMLIDRGVRADEENQAEDLCACMLKITSTEYTRDEAKNMTDDQLRKALANCNYSW